MTRSKNKCFHPDENGFFWARKKVKPSKDLWDAIVWVCGNSSCKEFVAWPIGSIQAQEGDDPNEFYCRGPKIEEPSLPKEE